MERRDFFRRSAAGLVAVGAVAGADAAQAAIVDASAFGAVGDGLADDTAALQRAIDAGLSMGRNVHLPTGRYKITAPLVFGSASAGPNLRVGWRFSGDGNGAPGVVGGTVINFVGKGAQAIIKINASLWRFCEFSNFTIACADPQGASYGLLFASTELSQHTVRRVSVFNVGVAFGELIGTGANGEFILYEDCAVGDCEGFWYNNSGQAFVHFFTHCRCDLKPGGTYFTFSDGHGGGGINVVDFNGTSYQANGISNTTLLSSESMNSCANFFGGRLENVTCLYRSRGGSPNLGIPLVIQGMEIGIDFDPTNPALAVKAVYDSGANNDNAVIESTNFFASQDRVKVTFPVRAAGWGSVKFRNCQFVGFDQPPYLQPSLYAAFGELSFEDCQTDTTGGPISATRRLLPLDLHYEAQMPGSGKRRINTDNAWAQSGLPSNFLVKPEVTLSNGPSVTPDTPWVLDGAASIGAFDHNAAGNAPPSSSPFAKTLILPPRTSLHQDITAIDLSSADYAQGFAGLMINLITYQAMVTFLGRAPGSVELVDSVSGQVYAQFPWEAGGPSGASPKLITLSARVIQTKTPSHPRLRISNLDATFPLVYQVIWHYVSPALSPTFAPSTHAPISETEYWGVVAESGRFWHRLALPYKSDAFGKAAIKPLPDLRSDVYLSKDTGQLTLYRDGAWEQLALPVYVEALPTSGQWPQGMQAILAAPSAGASPGWAQITPGRRRASRQWAASTAFGGGTSAYNGSNVYEMTAVSGISAAATGPVGTGSIIADGTCIWNFVGTLAATACAVAWPSAAAVAIGEQRFANGSVYECTQAGKTAASGAGPSETVGEKSHDIVDGSARWRYVGPLAVFKALAPLSA